MAGLSRSLEFVRDRYDVIVVGSGYGGGVAASRLARSGKRVAVLERGREVLTGQFPNRFPDLKNEMQVTGKRLRTGPSSALFDVRLGEDMHVLVGCGLGGGSLINAGVALRPDTRVFADERWPGQIAQDGLLDEGFRRADAVAQSAKRSARRELLEVQDARGGRRGARLRHRRAEDHCELRSQRQRCRHRAAGLHALRRLLRRLQRRRQELRRPHLPAGRGAPWRGALHARQRAPPRQDAPTASGRCMFGALTATSGASEIVVLRAPMVMLGAGTLGTTEILLRSRANGLPLSGRVGERFSANGDIIAFGYGAREPVNAVGVGFPAKVPDAEIGAAVSGMLEVDDATNLANELRVQEGVLPSAIAPALPVLFIPNGRLLGALQSLVNGVYKGPFAKLQTFFAVSHDSASGRFSLEDDRLTLAWPNAKDEPVYARLDALLTAIVTESGGSYVKNPLAGTDHGTSAGDGAPARRRRHGARARRGRRQSQGAGVRCRCAVAARLPCTKGYTSSTAR